MKLDDHAETSDFRVWITQYDGPPPADPADSPPAVVALEPAEVGTMSAEQAAVYVEAFNRRALAAGQRIWAVALPVIVRYDGDPKPGEPLPLRVATSPRRVGQTLRSAWRRR